MFSLCFYGIKVTSRVDQVESEITNHTSNLQQEVRFDLHPEVFLRVLSLARLAVVRVQSFEDVSSVGNLRDVVLLLYQSRGVFGGVEVELGPHASHHLSGNVCVINESLISNYTRITRRILEFYLKTDIESAVSPACLFFSRSFFFFLLSSTPWTILQ